MAFAQAFLSRARVELRSDTYGKVLGLIQQFDQENDESPVLVSLIRFLKENERYCSLSRMMMKICVFLLFDMQSVMFCIHN